MASKLSQRSSNRNLYKGRPGGRNKMSSMHAFAQGSSSDSSDSEVDFLHPSTDPRADEFADYNPRKRRRTGRDAKESAALGVFGSESEDEGPGQRWKKKSLRSKGMQFVSTGQKKMDDEEEEEEEEDDNEEEIAAEDEDADMEDKTEAEETAGLRGLGWQSSTPAKKPNISMQNGTPLGRGFVPSSAAVPILRDDLEDEVSTPRISRPSAFSTPNTNGKGKGAKAGPTVNAGSFAARMMAKMGYKEGQGLGKEGTGRSGVIEVTLRPQGVGLGAVKEKSKQEIEEEKRQAKIKGVKYEGSSDEEVRKKRRQRKSQVGLDSGTGSASSTPRRVQKPKYRTVQELQQAAPGLNIPDAFAPILDMTGPGQRLLTSTSGLLTPTHPGFETAEQSENRKLARRAQNDLSAFVEEWKSLEERKAYIEMSIIQQQQELEEEQREYDQMKRFYDAVNSISESVQNNQWDPVLAALESSESDTLSALSETSKQFEELTNVAVAAVYPFLRQSTEGWNPLEDPKLNGMTMQLSRIRHILGAVTDSLETTRKYSLNGGSHRSHTKSTTTYESMIYKIIFPKIVSAINQGWDAHNPTPLIALFDAWDGLLPSFVRTQLLDQTVVHKLNDAVSSWNPRRRHEKDLPHLWLFPWLQYLPSHHADPKASTGLVSDVKRKFRKLIDTWDFRKGVVPGLYKWREVLAPDSQNDQWTPLIMNHVIPGMGSFLRNPRYFVVDPQDQAPYMPALQGILAWQDILSARLVGQVIAEAVFPLWHSVLHQWLTVVGPNQEIGEWFEWWRNEALPEGIRDLQCIQDEFDRGEDMINHALDLGSKAATHLPAPKTLKHRASSPAGPASNNTPARPKTETVPEEVTFKHRVEDWCIENDLQLLPEKKIMHSAGPLYRITAAGNGKNGTLAYFKGDSLVAVQKKGQDQIEINIQWDKEESRDALLEMAWYHVK